MDYLRLLGISFRVTSHTVGETHTDSYQHVALLFLQVHGIVAVHTQHANIQRMVGRQCRKSQHCSAGRNICLLQESLQFFLSVTQFHALTYDGQRLLGIVNQFRSRLDSLLLQRGVGNIRTNEVNLLRLPLYLLHLGILGEVKHHGTGTATACDIESTAHRPCYILGMTNLVSPLTDWLGNTHEVNLLESVSTQRTDGNLSGYHHDRR